MLCTRWCLGDWSGSPSGSATCQGPASHGRLHRAELPVTVRRFHRFLDGQEASQQMVEALVRKLEKLGNSPRSIGRHIYALRAYFAFVGLELDLGVPAFQKWLPHWLNDEEWTRLLAAAERPLREKTIPERVRIRAIFHRAVLMVYGGAGLRLIEGCALHREDIDLEGYIRVLGKGGVEKIVPVEDPVVEANQNWVATHQSPGVFPGGRGLTATPLDADRGSGVDGGCRHPGHPQGRSLLEAYGGHRSQEAWRRYPGLQDVLRHANISATQIYTQMAREELRKKLPRRFMGHRQLGFSPDVLEQSPTNPDQPVCPGGLIELFPER